MKGYNQKDLLFVISDSNYFYRILLKPLIYFNEFNKFYNLRINTHVYGKPFTVTGVCLIDNGHAKVVQLIGEKSRVEFLFNDNREYYRFYTDMLQNVGYALTGLTYNKYKITAYTETNLNKKKVIDNIIIRDIGVHIGNEEQGETNFVEYTVSYHNNITEIKIPFKMKQFNQIAVYKGRPVLPLLSNHIKDTLDNIEYITCSYKEYCEKTGAGDTPRAKEEYTSYKEDYTQLKKLIGSSITSLQEYYIDYY